MRAQLLIKLAIGTIPIAALSAMKYLVDNTKQPLIDLNSIKESLESKDSKINSKNVQYEKDIEYLEKQEPYLSIKSQIDEFVKTIGGEDKFISSYGNTPKEYYHNMIIEVIKKKKK